ncbi:MAG TPA: glycosyltransferase family 2 protein [Aeromicrobium sp.]|nr:glycosyltransferase family 2 protein [Aeromicrobium sp.]HKY58624.1 glycosyltransferase family 2 protein [Aeromicrobium sp.]
MADEVNDRVLLRDQALHLDKSSLTVADECLRFRFEESADLVALMASHGRLDYSEVLSVVRGLLSADADAEETASTLDAYALSSLMRTVAGQHASGPLMQADFAEAADLARAAKMLRGDAPLSAGAARIEGQVNLACRRFDHVQRMLAEDDLNDDTSWLLSTELAHPVNGAPGAGHDDWLRLFNRRFEQFGMLPVAVPDGPGEPFDRVTVDVPDDRRISDGPVVTVIMSTFKPDRSFRTAVRSLIDQTWQNLEILVIDDCSPAEYDDLLAEVTALDPRIQLIRMPVNGGTYRIRNEGIRRSRGEFVTFQDSDDWAHPERIARQIAPLLEHPPRQLSAGGTPTGLVATHCRCVRVFPNLSTLNVGMNSFRRCAPSTMFRKDVVIAALGGYDETRKEADNEFYERVRVVFGEGANLDLPDVMVLYQLTADSLSRDEYRFAWQHGARAGYIQARRYWHRQIAAGRESPFLDPAGPRRIHAPQRVLTGHDLGPANCDVLWISDWRDGLSRYDGQIGLVEATVAAGLSTLAGHTTTIRNANRDRVPLRDDILRLQAAGTTRLIVWSEPTHARLCVVTDPELLNLTRRPENVAITADRLVIAAPHPPSAPVGGWLTYDPVVVEANAQRMFGVAVEWLPASASIAQELRQRGATTVLEPAVLAVAPEVRERPYDGARGGSSLIVGTAALDPRRRDRPSVGELAARLPVAGFDVRVLDARFAARQQDRPRALAPTWVALDEGIELTGFLRQLDVFAPIPTRTSGPSLPWPIFQALACGAVVVADPALESFLGDAAIYAAAGEVEVVLKELANTPGRLDEQRRRGYAMCRDRASGEALAGLIGTLLAGREDGQ